MPEAEWIDLAASRERMEREAATLLGLMLFEYSRLDMEVGLHLVWSEEGSELERATKQLNNSTANVKLEYMRRLVENEYPSPSMARDAYEKWLKEADGIRRLRNDLVHGRWGPWGYGEGVSNVVGIPTSEKQRETNYTIAQLEHVLERVRKFRSEHIELRKRWPL